MLAQAGFWMRELSKFSFVIAPIPCIWLEVAATFLSFKSLLSSSWELLSEPLLGPQPSKSFPNPKDPVILVLYLKVGSLFSPTLPASPFSGWDSSFQIRLEERPFACITWFQMQYIFFSPCYWKKKNKKKPFPTQYLTLPTYPHPLGGILRFYN